MIISCVLYPCLHGKKKLNLIGGALSDSAGSEVMSINQNSCLHVMCVYVLFLVNWLNN